MKKYVIWNDTHKVLGIDKEFKTIEDAEKCINILRNNIRTLMKLNGIRTKFMKVEDIKFVIIDKEEYNSKYLKINL